MKLAIDIPDMKVSAFSGIETLSITPIAKLREELTLNAVGLKIDSVSIVGTGATAPRPLTFTHKDGLLKIAFNPAIKLGEKVEVVTRYSATPKADGTGLTWTKGRPDASRETDKFAQIHSQGQPDHNRKWFPCHDFPNERLTTELFVTVEDPYIVGSNGRLIEATLGTPSANGDPRMTWHWLQDKPHATYLISMVVGRFSIVGLPTKTPEEARIPCYLYAPVGTEKTATAAYAKTPAMVAHFSQLFAEPYAWDKYSQALVRNFMAGGMENTSATTMQSSSATAPAGSQDDIISHELAHQWFGDLMTCKGWEHAWLNEGWASFAEALWKEKEASPGNERREYQRMIATFVRQERGGNRTSAPNNPAMVSNRYTDPMQTFIRPNNIYSKGACVLHMLRNRLGDDAFWKGVHAYIQKHKFTHVETDDFRYALEEASGQSLERFFNQWCYRPGTPRLDVEIDWKPDDAEKATGPGELTISVKQTQKIDLDNPAYALSLPVRITIAGKPEYEQLDLDTKTGELKVKLSAKPEDVELDPGMGTIAPTSIKKPLAMWLHQARDTDSVFAQLQAAEHLALFEEPQARQALSELATSDLEVIRTAATESLTQMNQATALAPTPPH